MITHCLMCPIRLATQSGSLLRKLHSSQFVPLNFWRHNPTFISSKNFHFSVQNHRKIYVDKENSYAFNILPQIQKFQPTWEPPPKITTVEDLNKFLDQNWRGSNASEITNAFEKVKEVVVLNNITLSDSRFNKLVDGLMDHCEKLTDDQLFRLLCTLTEYPPCESLESHNFYDVWCCLDDICCWKMGSWNLQKLYTFAEVWYKWNLGRPSDYIFELLDKTTNKPKRLSKNMLVYTFFYLNVHRKKTFPFEIEYAIVEKINELSVDDLTIIAMGYFKTATKIKTSLIVQAMIRAISDNIETINEISLTAMLKVIRFSQRGDTAKEICLMLDKITEHLSRFSSMTLIHVALTGTSLQIKHEHSVKKCAERILEEISNIRIKDVERILVACSMFDIDTTPSIFEKAFEEISKDTRRKEFVQYNRCLPSTLNYLSLRNLYSYPHMSEVLNEEFINETYGKSPKCLPRDLFSLDMCIDIECPDYTGNRLTPEKKYKAAKWLTEFTPSPNQYKRLTFADKAYLEVTNTIVSIIGDERLVHHDHVLPHFSKSDIIVCKNRATGEFVEVFGFENYILGDIKKPFSLEEFEWFAVVVMTPNLTIRDTCLPLGSMVMKKRQLETIGYNPVFVYISAFADLSPGEKQDFLKKQLVPI